MGTATAAQVIAVQYRVSLLHQGAVTEPQAVLVVLVVLVVVVVRIADQVGQAQRDLLVRAMMVAMEVQPQAPIGVLAAAAVQAVLVRTPIRTAATTAEMVVYRSPVGAV